MLGELTPSPDLFYTAAEIFSTLWDHRRDNGKDEVTFMKRELLRIEKQSEHFINRIAETQSINLIVAYEGKVEKLEEDKLIDLKQDVAHYAEMGDIPPTPVQQQDRDRNLGLSLGQ